MNTWLSIPALYKNGLSKAVSCGATVAAFDLEDSIPQEAKSLAREKLIKLFAGPSEVIRAVRINSLSTVEGFEDLLYLREHNIKPDIIIIPKVDVNSDVATVKTILGNGSSEICIFGVIESLSSYHALCNLGKSPKEFAGIIFGAADFSVDLNVNVMNYDFSLIKQNLFLAARKLDLIAIDAPCFYLDCRETLSKESTEARQIGYSGKIALHPDQVNIISEAFKVNEKDIANAKSLLIHTNEDNKLGIARHNGRMVGPPFVKYAQNLVDNVSN